MTSTQVVRLKLANGISRSDTRASSTLTTAVAVTVIVAAAAVIVVVVVVVAAAAYNQWGSVASRRVNEIRRTLVRRLCSADDAIAIAFHDSSSWKIKRAKGRNAVVR